jgi:hypothetical protein
MFPTSLLMDALGVLLIALAWGGPLLGGKAAAPQGPQP